MDTEKVRKRVSVTVTLTEPYLKGIKKLLDEGVYSQRELFIDALQRVFKQHGIDKIRR